jgi:integrase
MALSLLSESLPAVTSRAAYASGSIGRDPTIGARSNRRRSGDEHKVRPDDMPMRAEVAAIWTAGPNQYRAAIALGATGLRIGEVLGLTADRVDVDHRMVTIAGSCSASATR